MSLDKLENARATEVVLPEARPSGIDRWIWHVTFDRSGKIFVVSADDGFHIYSHTDFTYQYSIRESSLLPFNVPDAPCFSPDSRYLAISAGSAEEDKSFVAMYDLEQRRTVYLHDLRDELCRSPIATESGIIYQNLDRCGLLYFNLAANKITQIAGNCRIAALHDVRTFSPHMILATDNKVVSFDLDAPEFDGKEIGNVEFLPEFPLGSVVINYSNKILMFLERNYGPADKAIVASWTSAEKLVEFATIEQPKYDHHFHYYNEEPFLLDNLGVFHQPSRESIDLRLDKIAEHIRSVSAASSNETVALYSSKRLFMVGIR